MTRTAIGLAVVALLVVVQGADAGTLDQQVLQNGSNNSGFISGTSGRDIAQTFTVGTTGTLDQFDLLLRSYGYEDDLYVDLRTTSSGAPTESDTGSNVLASFTLANSDMSDTTFTWESFVLSTGVSVTAGDVLALVVRPKTTVTDPDKNPLWGADAVNNIYTSGRRYDRYSSTWTLVSSDWDMAFKTYVETTAIPLPSAAWLGLGLLGAMGIARRLRRRKAA